MPVSTSGLIEIETEEDGRLPLTFITPIFPKTTALKFSGTGNQASCEEVPVEEGNFLAPEGGLGVSTRYIAVNPIFDIKPEPKKPEGVDKGRKDEAQSNSMERKELGKLQALASEKEKENSKRFLESNQAGSLEVVEEEHQDPNPPKSSSIPDPDESDNDILVIDLSEGEEVKEPENAESGKNLTPEQRQHITNECAEQTLPRSGTGMLSQYWEWAQKTGLTLPKEYKKSIFTTDSVSTPATARVIGPSTTSSNFQQAEETISVLANEPKNVGARENQVGVWKFAKRCQEAKDSQEFLGSRCQVMCPNLNQATERPCSAMLNLRNLGRHIQRHHNLKGNIDNLRCPDCDEHVSAESLQHHFQQHKTCTLKCMIGRQRGVARSPNTYTWKNPKLSMSSTENSTTATVSASASSPVQTQSFLSTYSTYLPPKSPSHLSSPKNLLEAPTAGAQLPVRVTDKKRPSSHTIWVRKDIFRPEVFAHKS